MLPPTQIIRTSRFGFGLTVAGAFAMATWVICEAMWDRPTMIDALASGGPSVIRGSVTAVLGAAGGGLLALLCGMRLSRQYCWLFCVAAGMMLMWSAVYFLAMSTAMLPQLQGLLSVTILGVDAMMFSYLMLLMLCVGGGICLGVGLTRTRPGLARRSRVAALIGLVCGALAWGVIQIAWLALRWAGGAYVYVYVAAPRSIHVASAFTFALGGAALAAALLAEKYEPPRFAVIVSTEREPVPPLAPGAVR